MAKGARLRTLLLLPMLAGGLAQRGCKPSNADGAQPQASTAASALSLKLAVSKPQYAPGEPVVLSIAVSNSGAESCRVSRVADGFVSIVSLTRDGVALTPIITSGDYINGFTAFLTSNLVSLAPKASRSLSLASAPAYGADKAMALEAASLDAKDTAALAIWPVDRPGRYEIAIRYIAPPLPGAADLCRVGGRVSAAFVVRG